jgi:hypothetical protein
MIGEYTICDILVDKNTNYEVLVNLNSSDDTNSSQKVVFSSKIF